MVFLRVTAFAAATLLGGCAVATRPPQSMVTTAAVAPEAGYVWARNDGQRMSGNPELLSKGHADQERCRRVATAAGALDQAAFIRCMEASGYSHRAAGG